jgi:transposase InsO family protein
LDQGIVVTDLPTLFHGGTGELKALGRRLISARPVLQLHEGCNSDARFLLQELHLRALFEDVGQSPIEWLSDNGSCYIAGNTRSFAHDIGLEPSTTPIKSPQSNGMAEAFVRTIKRYYARVSPPPNAKIR